MTKPISALVVLKQLQDNLKKENEFIWENIRLFYGFNKMHVIVVCTECYHCNGKCDGKCTIVKTWFAILVIFVLFLDFIHKKQKGCKEWQQVTMSGKKKENEWYNG